MAEKERVGEAAWKTTRLFAIFLSPISPAELLDSDNMACLPMKSSRNSLLLTVVLLLFVPPARGLCNDPRPRMVCAEYFASKVVVEGTLVKVRSVHDRDDPEGVAAYVYTLNTNRVIRGQIDDVFRIYEGNDSGRATFDWKTGRKYLLFLSYSDSDKAWKLDGCGNSGPLNGAKAVLGQIDAIQKSHGGGVIHGAIRYQVPEAPVSQVRIEARGANGVYTTTTNAKGEFSLKVSPGQYAVRAIRAGFSFGTAEFSYENPRKLQIEPGGCAQVQLLSMGQRSR